MDKVSNTETSKKHKDWWEKIESPNVHEIKRAVEFLNEADYSGKKSDIMKVYNAIALIGEEHGEDLNTLKNRLKVIEKRAERRVDDTLGLTIKHYREEKGMTLQEVSEKAGVSVSYIHRIEKGTRSMPSFPILEQIATALSIPVSTLLPSTKEHGNERVKIDDILISGDVYIENQPTPLSFKEKELISNLVNAVYNSEWTDERAKELLKMTEIITEIKKEHANRMKSDEKKPKKRK